MSNPCSCKKVVATGARTTVIMQEQRCFGFLNGEVATPTNYLGQPKKLEITSESMINEIGTFQSAALTPERAVVRRQQGTSAIGGDITVELSGNGYAWMIVQAIGKIVGAGASNDPYTILPVDSAGVNYDETAGYKQNSDLYASEEITYNPACSDCLGYEQGYYEIDAFSMEPGMTLFISRDGGTIGGPTGAQPVNQWWFKYVGEKVNTWSITASPTEIVTSTFSLLGRLEEIVDIPEPTSISRPDINDPFSGFNGEITIDGDTECILSFDLTVNNNLGADQYCMGDRYRNSMPEGRREIEGTITTELTDLVFYNKFLNQISARMVVNFDLFADTAPNTETMKIILPKVEFNGTTPTSSGPEAIVQELPFIALFDKDTGAADYDSLLTKGALTVAPNGFDIAIEIVTAGQLV